MSLAERFGTGLGLIVGVQAEIGKGIQRIEITGVRIRPTNTDSERNIEIQLDVDGDTFQLDLQFRDETLEGDELTGRKKKKETT